MVGGVSQRQRPKRRVSVKIQLSKQDLQEYLDDGYTAADIAKDFSVSPAIIIEKMRKFGVKKTKQTKVVKKVGRPTPPKKQKPRGRPPRRQPPPRKGKTNLKEQGTLSKQDLQSVVTQVIQDNPEEAVDHIHDLLRFMGFDLAKSVVEDRLRKWKASSEPSDKRGQKSPKQDDLSKEGCENGQQIRNEAPGSDESEYDGSKATVLEKVDVTAEQQTDDKSPQSQVTGKMIKGEDKEDAGTSEEGNPADRCDGEIESSIPEPKKKRGPGRPRKIHSNESHSTETVKMKGPRRLRKIRSNEGQKTESVNKRGPGRPSKRLCKEPFKMGPVKIRRPGRPRKICSDEEPQMERVKRQRQEKSSKTNVGDTDASVNGSSEDTAVEDSVTENEGSEGSKTKKRGGKRGQKRKTKKIQSGSANKRGRPCLNLSPENLKLCVENGLPVGKIAEALGTCRQSVNRYLQVYKMRKTDRYSNLSNDELDKMVSEMCTKHPQWGQVRIQEELKQKGLHFRRVQIRNSVRRVDPVGIELRKLNNLKMRWNRGSLNRLDKILPEDGINMTSTESFISRPPRNGLNGLKQEDCVRLLKSIVTTHKKTYVEPVTRKVVEQTQSPTTREDLSGSEDMLREVSKDTSDQENIGPDSSHEDDLRIESPQLSGSEDGKEFMYRQMLYNMVMSTQKSDREGLSPTEDAAVDIPKEELKACVENGFSSSRIADKYGTTITNIRRQLTMHKLAMSTRFEMIPDETIDEIVMDVIREFSIKKGSEVHGYVRKKGFRIRKVDIHSSLSRLYPKGLHRKGCSILQQSWDAASEPQPSDMECTTTEDQGQGNQIENGGVSETVVMLNSEELAQLMNGEGSITLVEQQGSLGNRNEEGGLTSQEQITEISEAIANTLVTTGDVQQTVKPQEDEISAIIVEIGLPGEEASNVTGQVVGQVDVHGGHSMAQYDATQQHSQEVVVVVADEAGNREHISNVIAVNTIPSNNGDETGSEGLNI